MRADQNFVVRDDGFAILRLRLKSETASFHRQVEERLSLLDPRLDFHRFKKILERFYFFNSAFERKVRELGRKGLEAPHFYLPKRTKIEKLESDLRALKIEREESAPTCDFSWLDSDSKLWGAIYVIEGSTLGGRIIGPHLKKKFGEEVSRALSYFEGYGPATGEYWQEVLSNLGSLPGAKHDEAVRGALQMFQSLLLHFDEGKTHSAGAGV